MNINHAKSEIREIQSQIYVTASEIGDLIQQDKLIQAGFKKNELFTLADKLGEIQNEMTVSCITTIPTIKTITNLRVEDVTGSQAFLRFDIDPSVDVEVEINDGSGYVSLANTGVFPSHNYAIHNQTTVSSSTNYTIRLTPTDGSAVCEVSFVTTNSQALTFEPTDLTNGSNLSNMSLKANGDTLVTIQPNGNYGIDPRLSIGGDEAWISYCVQLQPNWSPTSNVKLPGFAAPVTGGPGTGIGGQGGGGSGGALSWSARMVIQRPSTAFTSGGLGFEVYHDNSSNAPNGETMWWGNSLDESSPKPEASIADGQWHCITQHIKLNDIGQNNGVLEGWLDGVPLFQRTDLGFTDNTTYHDVDFWMNVYHGGSADTSGTQHDICFKNFEYNTGAIDLTTCNC